MMLRLKCVLCDRDDAIAVVDLDDGLSALLCGSCAESSVKTVKTVQTMFEDNVIGDGR